MKFDYIGIFFPSIATCRKYLESILHVSNWIEQFNDPIRKVTVQFGVDKLGICYEIVAPCGDNNPVESLLSKSNNILYHIAYKVDNIDIEGLIGERCILVSGPSPAKVFNNNKIDFLYIPLRFIIELIENNK